MKKLTPYFVDGIGIAFAYKCMSHQCSKCKPQNSSVDFRKSTLVRNGSYVRLSDRAIVQRFICLICKKSYSTATADLLRWQKKRQFNHQIAALLVSGVSQRRSAKILGLNKKTVVRKFIFLGLHAKNLLFPSNITYPKATEIEFDDLETIEHTKCKPVSVTLAVESQSRRILSFRVAQMPAKGLLTKISIKKYGPRADHRPIARNELFQELKHLVIQNAIIKSDESPLYLKSVIKYFPKAKHLRYKGRRGCVAGQGELKKIGFDPIFSLNHTFAKMRADINRLFRRTWCTTKKIERLDLHIALYAIFHNQNLKTE